ncbi:endoplasmic reticulum transmembrane protein 3 [Diutina catenulata]
MAVFYNLVFGLLVIEMVMFTVVSLPFPRAIRRRVLQIFSAPFQNEQFQIATKFLLAFVFILFVDSVNRVWSVSIELRSALDPQSSSQQAAMASMMQDRAEIQARRFYSQRNMYLCGFTLFLTLIIMRTYTLVAELTHTKDRLDSMNTEGKGKAAVAEGQNLDDILELKAALSKKDEDLAILKEQAEKLSAEYEDERARKKGEKPLESQ